MTPFPHQLEPIRVLSEAIRNNRSALDASETGVGKTAHALFACKKSCAQVAVVCPKSVVPAWRAMAKEIGVSTLFVENIEALKAQQTWLQGDGRTWKWNLPLGTALVFDEVHRFSGSDTENGVILACAPKPVLMLSATCASDPTKMRGIAHQLGLAKWSEWWSWCGRHGCKKGYWGGIEFKGRAEDLDKLHRAIFKTGLGTRVKQSEVEGFPDNFIEALAVPVEDQRAVDEAYKLELEWLEKDAPNAAVLSLRSRQISEHQKIPALLDLTRDLLASGLSVAIFVNFRDSLERIQKTLKCPAIYGDQHPDERQEAIDQFNKNHARALVCMIQAGGESISLPDLDGQHPRAQIICPGWSAREVVQAQGRCPRATSKSKVITKYLFAADTLEENILRKVQQKLRHQELINDGTLSISECTSTTTTTPKSAPGCESLSSRDTCLQAPLANNPSPTSNPTTSPDSLKSTCLPASADGPTHSNSQGGPMICPSGPAVAPVNPSPALAREEAPQTSATSGPSCENSLSSADLQSCLESKLRARLDVNGSLEYELTWKHWDMQSGPAVCVLMPCKRRMKGSDYFGVPTPQAMDAKGYSNALRHKYRKTGHLKHWTHGTALAIHSSSGKSSWPEPAFAAWLMGFPQQWLSALHCAVTAMPSSRKSRQHSSKQQ